MKKILKQKKEFKETRKKGREKENERERGEREGERKGYSFRELSSHVKDSYDCAPNCICIQISVFYYFILQFIFHIRNIIASLGLHLIFFPTNDVRKSRPSAKNVCRSRLGTLPI